MYLLKYLSRKLKRYAKNIVVKPKWGSKPKSELKFFHAASYDWLLGVDWQSEVVSGSCIRKRGSKRAEMWNAAAA